MEFGTVLKETQARYHLTNQEIGNVIQYSDAMVSKIRSGGRRMPLDAIPKLAEIDPRFGLELYAGVPNTTLTAGWLDGEVDLSPLAVTEKVKEELQELLEDLGGLKLVNKNTRERFCEGDEARLMHARQEAYDAALVLAMWLVVTGQAFGIDMRKEAEEHRRKLMERGYLKKKTAARAVR